jgi:hypothetical protein
MALVNMSSTSPTPEDIEPTRIHVLIPQDAAGDMYFKTTDGIIIKASSSILKQASSVFADIFSLPTSGDEGTELSPVDLYASSTVLMIILDICYHIYSGAARMLLEYEMETLLECLMFAQKFFMDKVLSCLRQAAFSSKYDPFKAYFAFSPYVTTEQQYTIARSTLSRSIFTIESMPEMEHCTAATYQVLMNIHIDTRKLVFREFERFPLTCQQREKQCRECKEQVPWAKPFSLDCLRKLGMRFDRETVSSCFTDGSIVASLRHIDCLSCCKGLETRLYRFSDLQRSVEGLMTDRAGDSCV